MALPTELTTSDWVDYLATLDTREERIVALATYHRRIENAARAGALDALSAKDSAEHAVIRKIADAAIAVLDPTPDYSEEPKQSPEPPPPPPVPVPPSGEQGKGKG